VLQNPRRRGEAQHIVNNGRLAEQTDNCRQRRLNANLPALPLKALQERRFFAADVSASAESRFEIERVAGAEHARAEQPASARPFDRPLKRREGVRIFGADIDIATRRADRDARDGHALDQEEGIALHQHAVGERAAVALVGVANNVLLIGVDARGRAPLDARRKARSAAPAKA
jgi:hypothetical protein